VTRSEDQERRCQACGTRLARDNRSRLCSPCSRHEAQASSAPIKQDGFWERTALRDALESRHFGGLLLFPWVSVHGRPGRGGQSPPRVRVAMAMSASALW
jgi:hypothetical protein